MKQIQYSLYIRRKHLQENPDTLFVFGDNLVQRGLGGQAKECRGEPNAVGIPTKNYPSMRKNAFMRDSQYPEVKQIVDKKLARLESHLAIGKPVCFPMKGIGTGRARLKTTAPKIFEYIQTSLGTLQRKYS